MAFFRALESTRPEAERLVVDPFAMAFLRPQLRFLVHVSRVPPLGRAIRALIDRWWPGARTSGVARTRAIDEEVEAGLDAGIAQCVILGAGFDTRPYRIARVRDTAVFEVDYPSTSEAKRRGIAASLGRLPPHVRFIPLDFTTGSLEACTAAAGYTADRRTLFVWEGVTNYLHEDAVNATLRWCARAAPGSLVIFTYVDRQVLDCPSRFNGTRRLFESLEASGERWTFGLDPAAVGDFVAECGLVLERDLDAVQYRARWYGSAARAMRGYEFYHLVVARVGTP